MAVYPLPMAIFAAFLFAAIILAVYYFHYTYEITLEPEPEPEPEVYENELTDEEYHALCVAVDRALESEFYSYYMAFPSAIYKYLSIVDRIPQESDPDKLLTFALLVQEAEQCSPN